MPLPYIEMLLCERFGWTFEELDNADGHRVMEFISMWQEESAVAEEKEKAHTRT